MIPLILHTVFTYFIFSISVVTNSLFIWISATTQTIQIGTYRYLLIGFASTDILVAVVHAVLMPGIQMTSEGYIFFGYNMLDKPSIYGIGAGMIFVLLFYQSFILLAYHFLYRFARICEPWWRHIFKRNPTAWWFFVSTVAQIVYTSGFIGAVLIGFMPSESKTSYYSPFLRNHTGIDVEEHDFGYLAIVFRSENGGFATDAAVAIAIVLFLFSITLVVIISCHVLIRLEFRRLTNRSDTTLKLEKELVSALIAQTSIPCILSYLPLGIVFVVPLFGLSLPGVYGDLFIMLTAIFPAVDPVIMLLFVPSYRKRVVRCWRRIMNKMLKPCNSTNPEAAYEQEIEMDSVNRISDD